MRSITQRSEHMYFRLDITSACSLNAHPSPDILSENRVTQKARGGVRSHFMGKLTNVYLRLEAFKPAYLTTLRRCRTPLAQDLGRLDAPDFGGVHARPGLAQRIV